MLESTRGEIGKQNKAPADLYKSAVPETACAGFPNPSLIPGRIKQSEKKIERKAIRWFKVSKGLWLEKKKMKENAAKADKIIRGMERVREERLSPMRNEQMKLENGRFQTSRRSCSPGCVGYL